MKIFNQTSLIWAALSCSATAASPVGAQAATASDAAIADLVALGLVGAALVVVHNRLRGRGLAAAAAVALLTVVSYIVVDQVDATFVVVEARACFDRSADSAVEKLMLSAAIGLAVGALAALFGGGRTVGLSPVAASALLLVAIGLGAVSVRLGALDLRIVKPCGERPVIALQAPGAAP